MNRIMLWLQFSSRA